MGTIFVLWGGTDILQGVDIPADKKLCEKGNVRKIVQEDFLSRFGEKWPYTCNYLDQYKGLYLLTAEYILVHVYSRIYTANFLM